MDNYGDNDDSEDAYALEDDEALDDDELDRLIELSPNPLLDDALILRLTYDLATRLHSLESIAKRYSLDGLPGLQGYLLSHPEVVAEVRKLRAIFNSDSAAEDRVRMKFLHATERLILPMAGLVADPKTPLATRVDGFKQIQRGAGMDGLSAAAKTAQRTDGGQPFSLTINFAGGRLTSAAAPITITGTTADGDTDTGDDFIAAGDNQDDQAPDDGQVNDV